MLPSDVLLRPILPACSFCLYNGFLTLRRLLQKLSLLTYTNRFRNLLYNLKTNNFRALVLQGLRQRRTCPHNSFFFLVSSHYLWVRFLPVSGRILALLLALLLPLFRKNRCSWFSLGFLRAFYLRCEFPYHYLFPRLTLYENHRAIFPSFLLMLPTRPSELLRLVVLCHTLRIVRTASPYFRRCVL